MVSVSWLVCSTPKTITRFLGVSPEGIKRFSEEAVINYFNNFNDCSEDIFNNHCTFNPIDKAVELYERLVQAEKYKISYLEKLLNK